ncbi:large-conductance mechanosensitive channel [Mergibacter septicus]|uniref:large-conductance mechanosensitive channel protein MscL n=1 Tax=Mergibacter septicus TaxID=221402 RepID=UPI0011794762|nr:large-conductance mechanosensitive channel protein MscL [Mergibacter septicus]AWX14188.1 large-conductance mechanosensitive channel [Mergibacter septicus]
MSLLKEFRDFAVRGNVVDMAIGVVIGAAFGKIVSSLVSDIITPLISLFAGSVDFKNLSFVLRTATENTPTLTLKYGLFIQTVFDFAIIAFAIFIAIKVMNKLKKKQPEPAPKAKEPTAEEKLLSEIRDLLKDKK